MNLLKSPFLSAHAAGRGTHRSQPQRPASRLCAWLLESAQGTTRCALRALLLLAVISVGIPQARAGFIGDYALANFTLTNTNANGFTTLNPDGSLTLTGGNTGSDLAGTTDLVIASRGTGSVRFDYLYAAFDVPGFDFAGYLLGSNFVQLADTDGQSGSVTFAVANGEPFGFRVGTLDNIGEPGQLTILNFTAPSGSMGAVPEPANFALMGVGAAAIAALRLRRAGKENQA